MTTSLSAVLRTILRQLGVPLAPRTLQEITVAELRRDRVEHQQKIGVLNRQIEQIETNKDTLFNKGVSEKSDSLRLELARHIRILSLDSQGKSRALRLLFTELEAITGLLIIKENQEMIRQNGLTSIIARMDLGKLTEYVHLATVEGQLQWEKLTDLVGSLDESRKIGTESETEVSEEMELVRQMQMVDKMHSPVPVPSPAKTELETETRSTSAMLDIPLKMPMAL